MIPNEFIDMIGKMLGLTNLYNGSEGQIVYAFNGGDFKSVNLNTGYLGESYAQLGFFGMLLMSVLFAYVCITLASVITRKARVITAIGLYYGANSVLNFVRQMFLIFGTQSLFSRMDGLSGDEIKAVFALVFLAAFLFIALLCGFMYILQRYMLDKKLNLA